MFAQNLNSTVSKPNVMTGQIPYRTTEIIPIDLMFQENFPTHTQVWTAFTIEMTAQERNDMSYLSVLQQQPVLGQEHQSSGGQVFHHVHGLG